jgi:hypothetical protein
LGLEIGAIGAFGVLVCVGVVCVGAVGASVLEQWAPLVLEPWAPCPL